MLLEHKNAMIYGAGGSIGGAVARAFAREGAKVFLTGRTMAPIEALSRSLAAELGPYGIRVVCLRSAGSPETAGLQEAFDLHAKAAGTAREQFQASIEGMTLLRRLPTLAEVENVAAFIASDQASAMTGTMANLTCGTLVD